jgi:hypothetical protein
MRCEDAQDVANLPTGQEPAFNGNPQTPRRLPIGLAGDSSLVYVLMLQEYVEEQKVQWRL